MKKYFFTLTLLILVILPTFAADWFEIYPKIYMDNATYTYNNQTKRAKMWVKKLNSVDSKIENINGKKVWYWKTYYEFSCTEQQFRILSSVYYDLQQNVLDNYDSPYNDFSTFGWNNVVPDSIGEVLYQTACKPNPNE